MKINKAIQYLSSIDLFAEMINKLSRRVQLKRFKFFRRNIEKQIEKDILKQLKSINFSFLNVGKIFIDQENDEVRSIIDKADNYLNGYYDILGSGEVKLDPIDWHTDFKSGFRWNPGKFYLNYLQESIETPSDVKVPRELSRSHQLLHCSIAYFVTKEDKYAQFVLSQIHDWVINNPFMHSINWRSTMDVAIRAVNWIWALAFIEKYKGFGDEIRQEVLVNLYKHGWFIYNNPENESICNDNHYISDLSGQIHLGLLFIKTAKGNIWLSKGMSELYKEMRYQILPSGMSYERSNHYNRLVLELLVVPILLLKRNKYEIPLDILYRLETMFEFIMYSLKPNGESPTIGDHDNGRLLPFGVNDLRDFKYLLSIGALLFKRGDFKANGNGYNIYCKILNSDLTQQDFEDIDAELVSLSSRKFPDSGFYIMRHENNFMIFNAGARGLYPELVHGGHPHSDLLSFELCVNGKSFLTDSGTYVYTSDAKQRLLFRSTSMHNTITVDQKSQNIITKEDLWTFHRTAIPTILSWKSNNDFDSIVASHNGYERLKYPITHKRSVLFDKNKNKWTITDELIGTGIHLFELNFIFDVECDFDIVNENSVITNCTNENIKMMFSCREPLKLFKEDSWISKSFGTKTTNKRLIASTKSLAPLTIKTTITAIN